MKTAWALLYPDGRILADSAFRDETEVWKVGLGWPDEKEIANAKRKGYRVERVEIHIRERVTPALPDLGSPLQQECYMDALREAAEKL